ncbi:hypothetical protein KKC91_03295 [bacterium]|nr:hypothetical protein [bacterium]
MNCKYCIDDIKYTVEVVDIETKCKYHKKIGEVYSSSAVAPAGLCRELFYTAYPRCLAVLYSGKPTRGWLRGKGVRSMTVRCPAANGIKVLIRVEDIFIPPIRMVKELVEELCKVIYRPLDGPFRKVAIEIIETGSDCPKGYHMGDTFYFNVDKQDELCPAGFATIYPYLRRMRNTKKNNGLLHSIKVHCPDCVGVTYNVTIKEDK